MKNDPNDPLDPIENALRITRDQEHGENYRLWYVNSIDRFIHEDGTQYHSKQAEQFLRGYGFDFSKGRKFISPGNERLLLITSKYRIDGVIRNSAVLDKGIHFYDRQKYLVINGPIRLTPAPGEFPVTKKLIEDHFSPLEREIFETWIYYTVRGFYNFSRHRTDEMLVLNGDPIHDFLAEYLIGPLVSGYVMDLNGALHGKPVSFLKSYLCHAKSDEIINDPRSTQLKKFTALLSTGRELYSRDQVLYPFFLRGVLCLDPGEVNLLEPALWDLQRNYTILECLPGPKCSLEALEQERPAYLWHLLHEYQVPKSVLPFHDPSTKRLRYFSLNIEKLCFAETDTYVLLQQLIQAYRDPKVISRIEVINFLENGGVPLNVYLALERKSSFSFHGAMRHLTERFPEYISEHGTGFPKWRLKNLKTLDKDLKS